MIPVIEKCIEWIDQRTKVLANINNPSALCEIYNSIVSLKNHAISEIRSHIRVYPKVDKNPYVIRLLQIMAGNLSTITSKLHVLIQMDESWDRFRDHIKLMVKNGTPYDILKYSISSLKMFTRDFDVHKSINMLDYYISRNSS